MWIFLFSSIILLMWSFWVSLAFLGNSVYEYTWHTVQVGIYHLIFHWPLYKEYKFSSGSLRHFKMFTLKLFLGEEQINFCLLKHFPNPVSNSLIRNLKKIRLFKKEKKKEECINVIMWTAHQIHSFLFKLGGKPNIKTVNIWQCGITKLKENTMSVFIFFLYWLNNVT